MAPSPPTQTGQAVLPHPAFQFVALDGLAQALDSGLSEESYQPRRLVPRSPVFQAVHCQVGAELQARFSGASGRTALRHYPDPFGLQFPRRPTPRPCPPSLHGRYPLPSYYEDSDPDRPFRHQPWFPDSRHLDFRTFHLQPSAVLDQTRSTPSALTALFCSWLSPLRSQARQNRRPNRVHSVRGPGLRYGLFVHFQLLPTRGYGPGAVTFRYWPYSVGQVRDSHPAVQMRSQAHERRHFCRPVHADEDHADKMSAPDQFVAAPQERRATVRRRSFEEPLFFGIISASLTGSAKSSAC
jgi:hypothetical protein